MFSSKFGTTTYSDVALGDALNRVLWDFFGRLEAVDGEVALGHHTFQRRGNTFDGMHEERHRTLLNLEYSLN